MNRLTYLKHLFHKQKAIPIPVEKKEEPVETISELIKPEINMNDSCNTQSVDQYISHLDTDEEPIIIQVDEKIEVQENISKELDKKNILEYKKAKKELNKLLKKKKEYTRYINNINKSYSKKNIITKNNIFI